MKKDVVLVKSERKASRKSPDQKELEGAMFKNETTTINHQ